MNVIRNLRYIGEWELAQLVIAMGYLYPMRGCCIHSHSAIDLLFMEYWDEDRLLHATAT